MRGAPQLGNTTGPQLSFSSILLYHLMIVFFAFGVVVAVIDT